MTEKGLQIPTTKGGLPNPDRFCTYQCIVEKQDGGEHIFCTCVCHNDLPADAEKGETRRKPITKKNAE